MSWQFHRGSAGRISWSRPVAELCGTEAALFLAVCAHLTAEARGPFIRYIRNQRPLWSEAIPWSRWALEKQVTWLFGARDVDGDQPLDIIRRQAHRSGSHGQVYHFDHPDILKAYTDMVFGEQVVTDPIVWSPIWWQGPIDAWRERLINTLIQTKAAPGISSTRLASAIDVTLEEMHRDCGCGLFRVHADMSEFLDSWFTTRYADKTVSQFRLGLLNFDLFWGDLRRIAGLRCLRPSVRTGARAAYTLSGKVAALVDRLKGKGLSVELYLRRLTAWCEENRKPINLEQVFSPPSLVLISPSQDTEM